MLELIQQWITPFMVILVLILSVYAIYLHSKIASLVKKYDYFMKGENGVSLERKLAVEIKELRDAAEIIDTLFAEQAQLKEVQERTFQKIGFVKYNAFENIGNNLSFALTLLDGHNNGLCISSLYGRNESRIFSKPIINGKSVVSLSQEELESLHSALSTKRNEEVLVSAAVSN